MPLPTSATRLLLIGAAAAVGVAIGLGTYAFVYAKGASYMTNDPAACANCHVMREHFDAWVKSSHRAVATRNSCHTPHALVPKYVVKAKNGFWHSFYFTTGRFPDPLRITEGNRKVTERACRECHDEMVAAIEGGAHGGDGTRRDDISCIRCHRYVGHLVR